MYYEQKICALLLPRVVWPLISELTNDNQSSPTPDRRQSARGVSEEATLDASERRPDRPYRD